MALSDLKAFEDVDTSSDSLPLYLTGSIGSDPSLSFRVAVAVNGRIAATTVSYPEDGTLAFSTMIPEEFLGPGRNLVETFVVDQYQGSFRLRRGARR